MAESPKKGSGTGWHRQFNQCGAGIIEVDTGSSGFTPSATNHHSIQAVRFHVKVGRSPAPDRVGYQAQRLEVEKGADIGETVAKVSHRERPQLFVRVKIPQKCRKELCKLKVEMRQALLVVFGSL
jgi:hypothetical protein